MEKKHVKHPKIPRATFGEFGRNELAIVGATCAVIQTMAKQIKASLADNFKVAYVDADHKSKEPNNQNNYPSFELMDKIDFYQLQWQGGLNEYKRRMLFNEMDLVLVNGNHFKAQQQIIFIDEDRLPSLQKRLHQFTNVGAFILKDDKTKIPGFLKDTVEDYHKLPTFPSNNETAICKFIETVLTANIPKLNGLILAGGKSTRMGQDKGSINYHGKPQRNYLAGLIAPFCESVYISVNQPLSDNTYPIITDKFVNLGAMGAILSAFQYQPESAWLVLACDYPLMNSDTIGQLIENRKSSKLATAFKSVENEFPEPLVTIYEPKSYVSLLQFLAMGYACPRKVLINSDIHQIETSQPTVFKNVNHPEEMEAILQQIKNNNKGELV